MAPKIQACLNFIEKGGKKSVITESTKLEDRKYGTKKLITFSQLIFYIFKSKKSVLWSHFPRISFIALFFSLKMPVYTSSHGFI